MKFSYTKLFTFFVLGFVILTPKVFAVNFTGDTVTNEEVTGSSGNADEPIDYTLANINDSIEPGSVSITDSYDLRLNGIGVGYQVGDTGVISLTGSIGIVGYWGDHWSSWDTYTIPIGMTKFVVVGSPANDGMYNVSSYGGYDVYPVEPIPDSQPGGSMYLGTATYLVTAVDGGGGITGLTISGDTSFYTGLSYTLYRGSGAGSGATIGRSRLQIIDNSDGTFSGDTSANGPAVGATATIGSGANGTVTITFGLPTSWTELSYVNGGANVQNTSTVEVVTTGGTHPLILSGSGLYTWVVALATNGSPNTASAVASLFNVPQWSAVASGDGSELIGVEGPYTFSGAVGPGINYSNGKIHFAFDHDYTGPVNVSYTNLHNIEINTSPVDSQNEVPIDTPIVITFSEPMNPASLVISSGPCGGECPSYGEEWSAGNTVVTLTKNNGNFDLDTIYNIQIDSIENADGNTIVEPFSWSFTTIVPTPAVHQSPRGGSSSAVIQQFLAGNNNMPQTPNISSVISKLTRLLKYNSVGDDVKQLQQLLNKKGFIVSLSGPGSAGQETNYFGLKTLNSLKEFQKSHELVSDGIVGPITWNALNKE